jgi:predicted nucleotidyltransferase
MKPSRIYVEGGVAEGVADLALDVDLAVVVPSYPDGEGLLGVRFRRADEVDEPLDVVGVDEVGEGLPDQLAGFVAEDRRGRRRDVEDRRVGLDDRDHVGGVADQRGEPGLALRLGGALGEGVLEASLAADHPAEPREPAEGRECEQEDVDHRGLRVDVALVLAQPGAEGVVGAANLGECGALGRVRGEVLGRLTQRGEVAGGRALALEGDDGVEDRVGDGQARPVGRGQCAGEAGLGHPLGADGGRPVVDRGQQPKLREYDEEHREHGDGGA